MQSILVLTQKELEAVKVSLDEKRKAYELDRNYRTLYKDICNALAKVNESLNTLGVR